MINDVLLKKKTVNNSNQHHFFEFYKNVIDNIGQAVVISDFNSSNFLESKITYANKNFCKIAGYNSNEIVGKPTSFLLKSDKYPKNRLDLITDLSGGKIVDFTSVCLRGDDNFYEADVQIIPNLDAGGRFFHWNFTPKNTPTSQNENHFFEINKDVNYAILENTLDCLKLIDQNGRLQYMNKNGQCLMEIDNFEPFEGKYWWDLWNDENKGLIKKSLTKALKGEKVQFSEPCRTAKGTLKWWDVTLSRVDNELTGEPQIISTSRDITALKTNEEALRKTQERLMSGLKIANVALGEIDYITNTVEMSSEALQLYGLPSTNSKMTREELHSVFHPDFKHYIEKEIVELLKPGSNGIMEIEHPIILKSGEIRWLKVNKIVYFDHSITPHKPLYSILAAQDITERKKSEEILKENENRFRTFANSISQLAWIMTPEGVIEWCNDRFCEYTGKNAMDLENEGWQIVHHPLMYEQVLEKFMKCFNAGKAWEDTFMLRKHDGEYRWFLSRAVPVKNSQGEVVQWLGTNTDVSELKEMREELNRLNVSLEQKVRERTEELMIKNAELELMNEELSSFSFVASHDLQEPLRKIQSFSNRILELENFSGKTEDYFNRMIAAGERMQNLINDLLSFSRTNTMELSFFPCDLNKILKEVKSFHIDSIQEKEAIIKSDKLPIINGVSVLFSQLFSNLIGNSIKYSKPDMRPVIRISTQQMDGKSIDLPNIIREKDYYCLTFSDNGIGFHQEYSEKIFKLFQRLHRKEDFSGTGIGLTICKKIVTRLNGFITAEGELNVGATFKVYLPK